jgi:hypothetical protein
VGLAARGGNDRCCGSRSIERARPGGQRRTLCGSTRGASSACRGLPCKRARADSLPPLLDPPRTGLSALALSGLIHLKPPRIVYLSCDPATLARDVQKVSGSGLLARATSRRSISSPIRLTWKCWPVLSAASGFDERFETATRKSPRSPEVLRVPLHADAEARCGRSIASTTAIRRVGGDDEAVASPAWRLMMPAVHLDGAACASSGCSA